MKIIIKMGERMNGLIDILSHSFACPFACTYRTYEGPPEFNEAILSNYSENQYAHKDWIAHQPLENI